MEATAAYVQELLSLMRRVFNPETGKWLIDEDWIADGHMPEPDAPSEVANAAVAAELLANYISRLHLRRQAGQSVHLELWCEAADLIPRISRVAKPYGITVYSGGGMDTLKPKKLAAERAAMRSVPTIIGHIGDLNKAGKDIRTALSEDATAFHDWHREYDDGEGDVTIEPLALTYDQAVEHDLLDAEGKAEVDGLPVPVLDQIVCTFIESHLNPDIAWRVVKAEQKMPAEVWRLLSREAKKAAGGSPIKRGADWSWTR